MPHRRPLRTIATVTRHARRTITGNAHPPATVEQRVRRAMRLRTGGR
jgi:hypothetical protein